MWNEVTTIPSNLGIEIKLRPGGSLALRRNVSVGKEKLSGSILQNLYILYATNVNGGLIVRCHAAKRIKERFDVIWNYFDHSAAVTDQKVRILATQYCKDVDGEGFVNEMRSLPFVHSSNFGKEKLLPLDLLNKFYDFKLQERFPNACICLRILLTIPATLASADLLASLN